MLVSTPGVRIPTTHCVGDITDSDVGSDIEESNLLNRLDSGVKRRLQRRLKQGTRSSLRSAIRKLAAFEKAVGQARKLFIHPKHAYDLKANLYNEWSMCLWIDHMARAKSKRTGKRLAANTIATYVSLAKKELSVEYGFALCGEDPQRLPAILKQLRDARPIIRKKRRALRGRHLRAAVERNPQLMGSDEPDSASADAANTHAAVTTAWSVLARGGEVCPKGFDPSKHPTRADLQIRGSAPNRTATVWLRPLKKRSQSAKVPIVIAEYDHSGSDAAWALIRMAKLDYVPKHLRKSTPLFRVENSRGRRRQLSMAEFTARVKLYAECAGQDPTHFKAHSCRTGGATDCPPNPLLLQAKGRWDSEIGRIYRRMTRKQHIAASIAMQREDARDLEEYFPSFTQPAM